MRVIQKDFRKKLWPLNILFYMTEKKSKVCSKCKQEKSLCDFHKDAKGKFGVRSQCKKCKKERNAKYYQKNSEKAKELKTIKKGNKWQAPEALPSF